MKSFQLYGPLHVSKSGVCPLGAVGPLLLPGVVMDVCRVQMYFRKADVNKNGVLDYSELVNFVARIPSMEPNER